MANFGLFGDAPNIDQSGFQSGMGQATASGAGQGTAAGMAASQAAGTGPSAADAQMRAGLLQAQRTAASTAASTRGNFGLAGAQRTAQATSAGMQQDAINSAAQLKAKEQQAGLQSYIQATQAQREADLKAAGLSAQEAEAQAQLEAQQNMANQSTSGNLLGGIVGTVGSLAGGLVALSDANAKDEIQDPFYQPTSAGGAGMTPPSSGPDYKAAGGAFGKGISDAWSGLSHEQLGGSGGMSTPSPQDMMGYSDQRLKDKAYDQGMADAAAQLPPPPAPPLDQSPGFRPPANMGAAMGPMQAQPPQPRQAGPGDQAADEFLNSLQPHAFTWKDPNAAPNPKAANAPNLGIYAQEVEKTPWGQSIVQQEPGGYKQLDIKALTTALAAGAGTLKKQQDDHSQRLAALEAMVSRGR